MKNELSKTEQPCTLQSVNGCAFPELVEKCKEIVTCDTARISKTLEDGKIYEFGRSRRFTEREKEFIRVLNKRGESMYYIAKLLNRHPGSVWKYLSVLKKINH